ncbi:Transcriptional regulator form adherence 3 [Spathaspora sp. JA1]|nr:Transcriptional regulator form adherence 3 [Spathaspora sp. JA1]
MKFAKTLERALSADEVPAEWVEAAIQYKALKKCINKVVNELNFLGLEPDTLKLLFEDNDDSSKIVEINEDETKASNPIIAEYILTKSQDGHEIKPMLKLTLDYSNENYSDDHIYELGMQVKNKIESLLNDDLSSPAPALGISSSDNADIEPLYLDERSVIIDESDTSEKIIEIKQDGDALKVVASRENSVSPPSSPKGNPQDDSTGIDEVLLSPEVSAVCSPILTPYLRHQSKKNEIFIMLNSDSKFFKMLDEELESLDKLRQVEEAKIIAEVQAVAKVVNQFKDKKSELYKWRELFRIYIDSEVYFKYNESLLPSAERNAEQVKKNLDNFVANVEKSGALTLLKNKESVATFNEFIAMNYHLFKILQFQSINNEAFRKILKKFDKQTSLGIKNSFPKLISNDHIFMTGTSLAQKICFIIQNSILELIPQLEDYSCPICMSIAYKPIRLRCNHLFCVRCLVKMKQQNKTNCPICRRTDAILEADGSMLDTESMELMKKYFPVEVKQKLKERDKERYNELTRHPESHKCVIM